MEFGNGSGSTSRHDAPNPVGVAPLVEDAPRDDLSTSRVEAPDGLKPRRTSPFEHEGRGVSPGVALTLIINAVV
jgi:hypothetical protein